MSRCFLARRVDVLARDRYLDRMLSAELVDRVAELERELARRDERIAELENEFSKAARDLKLLGAQLERLLRWRHGPRSEKLTPAGWRHEA